MSTLKNISPSSLSDQELIAAYRKSGDLRVLATLYQPYMDMVFGVCLHYLKEREAAKDAVMAIFEELVQKLQKHEVDYFKGWLYSVAKNHCLMHLRSAKRLQTTHLDPEHMHLTETVHLNGIMELEEHLEKLNDCLKTLSEEQKKIIELFYLHQNCYKEIELKTGMDWNKVRSHIQNGRRNLKICMEEKIKNKAG
ncbi:MAG TPA: sigma-70 family RNA polymerase sigma factor [Puia sp.]|nr:sigma-70 family RNA polymerase sigma factor [Puia sp.]